MVIFVSLKQPDKSMWQNKYDEVFINTMKSQET